MNDVSKFQGRCPACGCQYRAAREHIGKTANCRKCNEQIRLAVDEPPPLPVAPDVRQPKLRRNLRRLVWPSVACVLSIAAFAAGRYTAPRAAESVAAATDVADASEVDSSQRPPIQFTDDNLVNVELMETVTVRDFLANDREHRKRFANFLAMVYSVSAAEDELFLALVTTANAAQKDGKEDTLFLRAAERVACFVAGKHSRY